MEDKIKWSMVIAQNGKGSYTIDFNLCILKSGDDYDCLTTNYSASSLDELLEIVKSFWESVK